MQVDFFSWVVQTKRGATSGIKTLPEAGELRTRQTAKSNDAMSLDNRHFTGGKKRPRYNVTV